jgi:glycosyltransferase involved in cell wall biosynthesis
MEPARSMTGRGTLPISVVIPAFNAERLIGRAIASVHAQTVRPAEIVVVSDGSTDGTARVARELGARVIVQENRGAGGARNTGVRAALCPWIAFLDADDEWHPDKLEVQWPATLRWPDVRLICTDFDGVPADGSARQRNRLRRHATYLRVCRSALGRDTTFIDRVEAARAIVRGNFVGTSTVLVSSELFLEGEFFNERGDLHSSPICEEAEDAEWLLRVLRRTDMLVVEKSLGDYRCNQPGSFSANQGRMRYGDAKLGERVAAHRARYVPGLDEEFARVRPQKQREAALAFLRAGQTGFARAVAREAFSERRSVAGGALLLAALLSDTGAGRIALEATRIAWKRSRSPFTRHRPAAS